MSKVELTGQHSSDRELEIIKPHGQSSASLESSPAIPAPSPGPELKHSSSHQPPPSQPPPSLGPQARPYAPFQGCPARSRPRLARRSYAINKRLCKEALQVRFSSLSACFSDVVIFRMLEDQSFQHVVAWGPQGDCFVVKARHMDWHQRSSLTPNRI